MCHQFVSDGQAPKAAPGGANLFHVFFANAVTLKCERYWMWVGLPSIQTAGWLNMSDDTLEALVIVYINNHTYNKVNTLLTQIYSFEIGSVLSLAKGRCQATPGPRGSPTLYAWSRGSEIFFTQIFFVQKRYSLGPELVLSPKN